jgi:hypothetical protein
MKTAVEWLVNELRNGKEFNDELIEQAKEMEKEQIMDAYIQGSISLTSKNDAEQYYKETYESND